MNRLDAALDGLRGTLLAACGLGVGACTASTPAPADVPTQIEQTPVEVVAEPEPEPEPEPPVEPKPTPELAPSPEPSPEPKPPLATKCNDPEPIETAGKDSGYVRCADGSINRQQVRKCLDPITTTRSCQGTEERRACETHADCTEGSHGFCKGDSGQSGTYCTCIYPCESDAECGSGEACLCPDASLSSLASWSSLSWPQLEVSECVPAGCKTNSDCKSGECAANWYFDGCRFEPRLRCRSTRDECRSNSDCSDGERCGLLGGDDGWKFRCRERECTIGRPLTVAGGVRVAGVAGRRWGGEPIAGLGRDAGRAAAWLDVARMEHASVASFARFAQELLHFGAPPDLLRAAFAAAADEVRHAEQTFALASAYAGMPIGPGALRVDDLRPTTDPQQFVTRLIVEGCVGETLGVAELLALLEHGVDPRLVAQLEGIAADETRHAALAWRTLSWFGPRVDARIIERAFAQAIAAAMQVDEEPPDPTHGRLGADRKRSVRAQAIASVIGPCRELGLQRRVNERVPAPDSAQQ